MRIYRGLPTSVAEHFATALAIGNFDGVHLGHQSLLSHIVKEAKRRGLTPAVMTFEPHPREVLCRPNRPIPTRISTLRDKLNDFEALGIKEVYLLPFSERLSHLSPLEFIEQILIERLNVKWLTVGKNFRFGFNREGSTNDLVQYGKKLGFETLIPDLELIDGQEINSTTIRERLSQGDLKGAATLLGHPYRITGRVIHGLELGRTLSFPTLNLAPIPPGSRAKPAIDGSFAVWVHGLENRRLAGVASIGLKPTAIEGNKQYLLETHVFDWTGDAYSRLIQVEFVERLRGEKKFESFEALKCAIADDANRARQLLGCKTSPIV